MQVVPSTVIAILAIAVLALRGPVRGLPVLLATAPLGAAAAFNLPALGGASILVLDLVAVAAFFMILLLPDGLGRFAGTLRPFGPGFWLLCVVVLGTVSALFMPRLFEGATTVFGVARSEDGIVETALGPSSGNLTQLFRLALGAMAFGATATALRARPDAALAIRAMAVVTAVHVALGWLDVGLARAGLAALLEPIRTANYTMLTEAMAGGMKRMVGGFPEASSYGGFALAPFAFWLHLWASKVRPGLSLALLALTALALLRSTSSGAYVAAAAFLMLYAGVASARLAWRVPRRRDVALLLAGAVASWAGASALVLAYEFSAAFAAFADETLLDKLASDSGVERMSWNAQAWRNFTDTWGLGAGLGSVRASSWLMASLGSIGALGTALYLAFLVSIGLLPHRTGDAARDAAITGLKAGCLAMLVSSLLSGSTPDLGVPFFAYAGIAAGLSRGGTLERRDAAARAGGALPAAAPR